MRSIERGVQAYPDNQVIRWRLAGRLRLTSRLLLRQHERTTTLFVLFNMSGFFQSVQNLMDARDLQTAQLGDFNGFTFPVLLEIGEHGFLYFTTRLAFAGESSAGEGW